jgi:hypothetical protein
MDISTSEPIKIAIAVEQPVEQPTKKTNEDECGIYFIIESIIYRRLSLDNKCKFFIF